MEKWGGTTAIIWKIKWEKIQISFPQKIQAYLKFSIFYDWDDFKFQNIKTSFRSIKMYFKSMDIINFLSEL